MAEHELKILPKYFDALNIGAKNFEIRKNDRNFCPHDKLVLKEWDGQQYTGRELHKRVSYVYYGDGEIGLADGYCVMGLSDDRWIPIKSRPMDEDERAEWSEKIGYALTDEDAVIYVSQLPDDGEEVLTCNRYGGIRMDTFYNDPDFGCYFEEHGDMDGIVAWMPLPKPYKEEQDGNNVRESNS